MSPPAPRVAGPSGPEGPRDSPPAARAFTCQRGDIGSVDVDAAADLHSVEEPLGLREVA